MTNFNAVRRLANNATFGNFSWMLADKVVTIAATLLVGIPLARYLGPADFGSYNFVIATAALLMPLASLGLNHIVTKELVEHPGNESNILGTAATLRLIGGACGILAVIAWMVLAPPSDARLVPYIIGLAAAGIPGSFLFLQYWFLGRNQMAPFAIAQIANTIIFNSARFVQIQTDQSIQSILTVTVLEAAFSGISLFVAYIFRHSRAQKWSISWSLARKLIGRSWPLILSGLTSAVYLKVDIIMLNELASPAQAGQFSSAAMLSEAWYFMPVLLATAAFPTLLRYRSENKDRYMIHLQGWLDVLAASATILAIFVTFASPFIIDLLYGAEFEGAALILSIHIWAAVFVFMRALVSKWMIAEDLYILSLVTHGIGAVVNVLLNLILIPWWGGAGAALATAISYAVASYFALVVYPPAWGMFGMMTKALFWPRRGRAVIATLHSVARRRS